MNFFLKPGLSKPVELDEVEPAVHEPVEETKNHTSDPLLDDDDIKKPVSIIQLLFFALFIYTIDIFNNFFLLLFWLLFSNQGKKCWVYHDRVEVRFLFLARPSLKKRCFFSCFLFTDVPFFLRKRFHDAYLEARECEW